MKQILVPTDFSEHSFNALEYTVAFHKNTACTFYIMNIGSLSESGIVSNGLALNYNKVDTHSKMELLEENIKEISKKHPSEQHQFYALQEFGNFIAIIRRTLLEKKIDLIAMGSKGNTNFTKKFIGSNITPVLVYRLKTWD